MLTEYVARLFAAEVSKRPGLMVLVHKISTLQEVRNPANATFGQRNLEVRIFVQGPQVQPVCCRVNDRNRHGGDPCVDWGLHRGVWGLGARTNVNIDHHIVFSTHAPQRIPVFIMDAGLSFQGGVVGEGDSMTALLNNAFYFFNGGFDIPIGHNSVGNIAAGVRTTPLINVPVVVRLEECQGIFLVLKLMEQAAIEGYYAWEVQRCEQAVGIHVFDPGIDIPGASAHLVERNGFAAVFFTNPTDDRVEPDVARTATLKEPVVRAVFIFADLGGNGLLCCGQVLVEHRRGFNDMVVDTYEDHVFNFHQSFSVTLGWLQPSWVTTAMR